MEHAMLSQRDRRHSEGLLPLRVEVLLHRLRPAEPSRPARAVAAVQHVVRVARVLAEDLVAFSAQGTSFGSTRYGKIAKPTVS